MCDPLAVQLVQASGDVVERSKNPREFDTSDGIHLAAGVSERQFEDYVLYDISGRRPC
jgi:hypothetical protein